jgi:monoterpene epsilon-lactone hydrolase
MGRIVGRTESMSETIDSPGHYHREHLLDGAAMLAMRAMLALQPPADLGPGGRGPFDELMTKTPAADGVTYEAANEGGIGGWWCHPAAAESAAAILYLHGGAYVVGSAHAYRHFAGQIASRSKVPVFVAEYGLAPERPFPAAIDDADAVYRALADAQRRKIAIVGDSAGGGLALVMAARMVAAAREGSLPAPVAAAALSPWTDLALTGESIETRQKHDPLLTRVSLDSARALYLKATDARDPRASPLYGDLSGLPPVMLHVGEDEILLDDSRRYADRLVTSGGSVDLHIWQGMAHVFPANVSLLLAARESLDILAAFLRLHLID